MSSQILFMFKTHSILIPLAVLSLTACEPFQNEKKAIELNKKGLDYYNQGDPIRALQLMTEARNTPHISKATLGNVLRNISVVFVSMEGTDSALFYSREAATCYEEGTYDYLINMADVNLYEADYAGAIDKLNQALDKNPDDATVHNSLGLIYIGEYDESFTDLEKALPHNKKAFEILRDRNTEYVLAMNYLDLEGYEQAEFHLRNLTSRYSDMPDQYCLLGMAQFSLGKYTEAELNWSQALAMDSSYQYVIELYRETDEQD